MLVIGSAVPVSAVTAGQVSLVSRKSTGGLGTGELVFGAASNALTANGEVIAFVGDTDLVPADTDSIPDVYLRNWRTGVLTLISTDPAGRAVGGFSPSISGDGARVAFESDSDQISGGDNNGMTDVFVRDVATGLTRLVSRPLGGGASNGLSRSPTITADGKAVVFTSAATNLTATSPGQAEIYEATLATGAVRMVSQTAAGTPADHGALGPDPGQPSSTGRYVAFATAASNLGFADTNNTFDIIRKDMQTGALTLVSRTTAGIAGGGLNPSISRDGNRVLFISGSADISPEGSGALMWDSATGQVTVESRDGLGNPLPLIFFPAAMSGDGRIVAFVTGGPVPGVAPGNQQINIFVRDRTNGTVALVTKAFTGGAAKTGGSDTPTLSANGRRIAFNSRATNLLPVTLPLKTRVYTVGLTL
jgi:Tol biopolymer transport system component